MLLLAGVDDLYDVMLSLRDVADRWLDLGICLRIDLLDLEDIRAKTRHSTRDGLRDMLLIWLRQGYGVRVWTSLFPRLPQFLFSLLPGVGNLGLGKRWF